MSLVNLSYGVWDLYPDTNKHQEEISQPFSFGRLDGVLNVIIDLHPPRNVKLSANRGYLKT